MLHYYNLSIYSKDAHKHWMDSDTIELRAPTFEAVMSKAKKYNIDISSEDWTCELYYYHGQTIEKTVHLYRLASDEPPMWDGRISIDTNPIPLM